MTTDSAYMQMALCLAERALGKTAPNPAVGCVLVKDGQVVGRGWTQPGGRPHAEQVALKEAGEYTKGATLYVTLEPCPHTGETPPCSDAIIQAGIARAVIACEDPDARVSGKGIAALKAAGIEVTQGVEQAAAETLNEGFFKRIRQNQPLVSLKIAASLDGKIAARSGESQWITSEAARFFGMRLRAKHDAVMVGIGTVLADNPRLTCRLQGMEACSPIRIVMDSSLRIPMESRLIETISEAPLWIMTLDTTAAEHPGKVEALGKKGAGVFALDTEGGRVNLKTMLQALAEEGITRLMVEGGATLATAFLRDKLADYLYWFKAPTVIGKEGLPAIGALGLYMLTDALKLQPKDRWEMGRDLCEKFAVERAA